MHHKCFHLEKKIDPEIMLKIEIHKIVQKFQTLRYHFYYMTHSMIHTIFYVTIQTKLFCTCTYTENYLHR